MNVLKSNNNFKKRNNLINDVNYLGDSFKYNIVKNAKKENKESEI